MKGKTRTALNVLSEDVSSQLTESNALKKLPTQTKKRVPTILHSSIEIERVDV